MIIVNIYKKMTVQFDFKYQVSDLWISLVVNVIEKSNFEVIYLSKTKIVILSKAYIYT